VCLWNPLSLSLCFVYWCNAIVPLDIDCNFWLTSQLAKMQTNFPYNIFKFSQRSFDVIIWQRTQRHIFQRPTTDENGKHKKNVQFFCLTFNNTTTTEAFLIKFYLGHGDMTTMMMMIFFWQLKTSEKHKTTEEKREMNDDEGQECEKFLIICWLNVAFCEGLSFWFNKYSAESGFDNFCWTNL
jgi:hypothetical protein